MLKDEKGGHIWSYQYRKKTFREIKNQTDIVAFVNENSALWDSYIEDIPVYAPDGVIGIRI